MEDSVMTSNKRGGSGNFANDRERASEAGRKGGHMSHGGQQSQGGAKSGQMGGNFAQDKEKASEAGRKGGQSGHGGRNR
jgi:general stress protein YciG